MLRIFVVVLGLLTVVRVARVEELSAQPPRQVRVGGGPAEQAFPPPPISPAMSATELRGALDTYLGELAATDAFSGVVLLARGDEIVYEGAYGFANRTHQVPNTCATRFNIASIGKLFTTTAVDRLVASGKLERDDTIGSLLPDYPNEKARPATVQQLLDHRGGIADFFGPDFDAASKAQFRANRDYFWFVAPRALYFEPGSQRRYCNGCYIVLGEIIARVSGVSYERYVAEQMFVPLGMKDTGWFATDGIEPRLASGYTRRASKSDGELRSNVFGHGAAGSAAGGIYSTAADLWTFVKSRRGERAMAVAGGAPGTSALIETHGPWTAIALSNLDPPAASVASAILTQLRQ